MYDNIPRFLIIGDYNDVNKVINKLTNKNKINNYYLYNMINPFIEYEYSLFKNDNDCHFKIVICPKEELNEDVINSCSIETASLTIEIIFSLSHFNSYSDLFFN